MLGTYFWCADVSWVCPESVGFCSRLEEAEAVLLVLGQWMLRMVDVQKAVAQRGFPVGIEAEIDFALEDVELSENAGAWRLSVSGGEGRLEPTEKARLRLGIGAFSSWYSGWADAATLLNAGLVEEAGAEGELLDACFAGRTPWMMNEF